MLKQNPVRRIKQQTQEAARMAVQTASAHSVQAPNLSSMANAGGVNSSSGGSGLQWIPFSRLDIDVFDGWVLA